MQVSSLNQKINFSITAWDVKTYITCELYMVKYGNENLKRNEQVMLDECYITGQ